MTIYLGRKKEIIMAIVTSIGRHNITDIRTQVQAALDNVGRELGLNIKLGGIRFEQYGFTFKGESRVVDPAVAGNPEAVARLDWNRRCAVYGLRPEHFGHGVRLYDGRDYQLVGFKAGKTKYPIIANRAGKRFKLSVSAVRESLLKQGVSI
jgi:hypothetical protein